MLVFYSSLFFLSFFMLIQVNKTQKPTCVVLMDAYNLVFCTSLCICMSAWKCSNKYTSISSDKIGMNYIYIVITFARLIKAYCVFISDVGQIGRRNEPLC